MGRDRSRSRSRGRGARDASPPRRRHDSPRRREESPRGRGGSRRDRSRSPQAQRRRDEGTGRERPRREEREEREERRYSPPPRDRDRVRDHEAGRDRDREGRRGDYSPSRDQRPRGEDAGRGGRRPEWNSEGPGEGRPPRPDGPPGGGGGRGFGGGDSGRGFGGGGRGRGRGRRGGGGEDDERGMQWGSADVRKQEEEEALPDKEVEPEFGLSGALAAEANKVNGVVLLHTEPPEARKPTHRWRLYVFKKGEPFGDPLHIHRQSSYLFGRERRVADVPTDHPSCSKQHAVLQFRLTEKEGPDGMMHAAVRPYMLDLGSTNGTYINNDRMEPERYYELLNQDMLRFGNSTREYVLLRDDTAA